MKTRVIPRLTTIDNSKKWAAHLLCQSIYSSYMLSQHPHSLKAAINPFAYPHNIKRQKKEQILTLVSGSPSICRQFPVSLKQNWAPPRSPFLTHIEGSYTPHNSTSDFPVGFVAGYTWSNNLLPDISVLIITGARTVVQLSYKAVIEKWKADLIRGMAPCKGY